MIKAGELPKILKFVPKIMLAMSIGILDDIYKKIAYWLNDKGEWSDENDSDTDNGSDDYDCDEIYDVDDKEEGEKEQQEKRNWQWCIELSGRKFDWNYYCTEKSWKSECCDIQGSGSGQIQSWLRWIDSCFSQCST